MYQIFKATQTLLTATRTLPEQPGLPEPLKTALYEFERRNRGHQHMLDRKTVSVLQTGVSVALDDETATRRETLRQTSGALLVAICQTPEETFLAPNPRMHLLLNTPDTSDWLEVKATSLVDWFVAVETPRPEGFAPEYGGTRIVNGEMVVERTFRMKFANYRAPRIWKFTMPEVSTLHSMRTLVAEAKNSIAADCASMGSWPEFSDQSITDWLMRDAKATITKALCHYTKDQLLILGDTWDQLKPSPYIGR